MIIENFTTKDLFLALGQELFKQRQRRRTTLFLLSHCIKVEQRHLERAELGKSVPHSVMWKILAYYNKKIKIELID